MHNSILTTAIVTFQNIFFNSDRKHLCLNFTIFTIVHAVHAFCRLKTEITSIYFHIQLVLEFSVLKECIFIQSKYNLNEEKQNFGHELPRNGSGHFTVTGHFRLPWKPYFVLEICPYLTIMDFKCHTFIFQIEKLETNMFIFSDTFTSKKPVVKIFTQYGALMDSR